MRLLSYCLAFALLHALASASPKPNFVFVLIDDMGYADLSCYGETRVETTHLDRLAREGIRFTQFYVGSPICSPSRTAFTTGQYPARWRITSFLASRKENNRRGMAHWLDPEAPTLARQLKQAGYATGHFGKWHMGGQRDAGEAPLITEYGFDQSLTQFEGLGDRILPLLDAYDGKPARRYALGSDTLGRGIITWLDRPKVTGMFAERALEFIRKASAADQPFYINLWPDDVHSPFFPPKNLREGATTKDELYRAVVKGMDEQLGGFFAYIRNDPKLRTNTLIIVASDNGPEPGAGSAKPFRGHKGTLYEGGLREPFIVWGPGLIREKAHGTLNKKTVVAAVDLFPSLLRIAGVPLPTGVEFDGEDLSPSLLGRKQQKRSQPLLWNRPPDRPGPADKPLPDLAIRDGEYKLLLMEDGTGAELYQLSRDPGESRNLASKQPARVKRLTRQLQTWRESLPISAPLPPNVR